ncbi:MAG TPA: pitrilysin family protein [Polyangiaceae bacterium]|nr:pitrilysin family protein [Polyangiaceae bacterium]
MKTAAAFLLALVVASCGGASRAPAPSRAEPSAPPAPTVAPPSDPLGSRPVPASAQPFVPPAPQVLDGPGKSKVWLLERHGLPLVTVAIVVPYGSAAEPIEKGGLAYATADMLDEGAGDRDALLFSQAINDLGARLASSADRDASSVSIQMLSSKLEAALSLLADAVVKPRHEKKDWSRVSALWNNALKNRTQEPNDVARVVTTFTYYGAKHPYAHPPDGTMASAKKVQLPDIAKWHKTIWRPDAATFVVVGDVKSTELTALLSKAFAAWKAPADSAPPIADPGPAAPREMRSFVVDRPEAPQIVMSWVRSGPRASDPAYAPLSMINIALGGSFTSRLNQNLREDHGWTYGARSSVNAQRSAGMVVVRAAIRADAIAGALREARKEVDTLAKEGLGETDVEKVRALLNGEALESYGTVRGVAGSLAGNASLGLLPDQDVRDLAAQRSASAKELTALATTYFDLAATTVVLVGPKDLAVKALAENGLPKPEFVDAEGAPVAH